MELSEEARTPAAHELGLVTRRQLSRCGVSPDAVRWRAGRNWCLVLPGGLLLHRGLPTEEQRRVAALLYAGDGSWLGGITAGALHGVGGLKVTAPIDVRVPAPRKPRRVAWVSIRSTTLVGDPLAERGPLGWSGVPQAVVERQARSLVLDAVQRRLVRLDDLEHGVDRGISRCTLRLRQLLHEAAAGVWSAPEGDLSQLILTSSALPAVMFNPVLVDAAGQAVTSALRASPWSGSPRAPSPAPPIVSWRGSSGPTRRPPYDHVQRWWPRPGSPFPGSGPAEPVESTSGLSRKTGSADLGPQSLVFSLLRA